MAISRIIKTLPVLLLLLPSQVLCGQQKSIHWTNGQWFDGSGFRQDEFFTVNGLLTKIRPERVDTVINLQQQYVIPPFGEAHNHSPDVEMDLEVIVERYLADGIFYIKNPNSIPFTTSKIKDKINHPRSVDVVYANGGITASGGHPEGLYTHLLSTIYKKSIPNWTNRSMEGEAYYLVNTKEELEKKWPFILSQNPGFIKTYLLYSEEYQERKDDTRYNGKKGLNPKLLPLIVAKARAAGLSVSCHAETPADVLFAVEAGVTEINHMPGYQVRWKEGYSEDYYLLPWPVLRKMKKKGVHTDATYSLSETELSEKDPLHSQARLAVQKRNLERLRKMNVPVTIGCDSYNKTARTEMEYLHRLGVFSNKELLKMWCETTPLAIFPQRKIAFLQEGYEASFLLLKQNPLEHFDALFTIQLRVKQGFILW
jgi:hypothetical protein